MKTTIEIPDAMLATLRERAARERTTLKALVQVALQQFIAPGSKRGSPFTLKDGSFVGKGMAPGVREGDWNHIRELAYEGRGGAPDTKR